MDKHWALNHEPYRGKNHYVIWVSGEGEIAEIICKDKTVVDKMAASKDMYEALKEAQDCWRALGSVILSCGLTDIFDDPILSQFRGEYEQNTFGRVSQALNKAEGR